MFARQRESLRFDVDAICEACGFVVSKVQPGESRRGDDRLRSISLTHRVGAEDHFFDGNDSQFDQSGNKVYREEVFTEFNEDFKGAYFWEVYRQMPFQVGRMRLMVLPPRRSMQCTATPVAARTSRSRPTRTAASSLGAGKPARPGGRQVYVFDTRGDHTAYNAGGEERVHLTMSMSDTELG
ncbi:hypothetical protein ALI22I_14660 [Saccharothrix sp. ALI-22-I]|uniref:hypothetical protein n=1 Tax=Saccharothrix sp. ALI-22-I TaxID=1933778 RepID=UPI0009CAEB6B|nr:hypothetical protein [Saccharothrix sp. ALI-22-I]ONI89730.1 hypothetical protein ALI22I_14660 [Saccharothrix sp. ALI-22-I]